MHSDALAVGQSAGQARFQLTLELEGNTVRAKATILNNRSDTTDYPERGQEIPAVYTNGSFWRLFTYDGNAPFTGAPMRQITKVWGTAKTPQEMEGGHWDNWVGTEQWAALVNDDGFGLGVYSPTADRFSGGFAGEPGTGGPKDGPTGYISPIKRVRLLHDTIYTYEYTLIVGQLKAIREKVYKITGNAEKMPGSE